MKAAIYGYGNLGRGVELALRDAEDMETVGVFTRRDPSALRTLTGIPVLAAADILKYKEDIDILIICAGSATDLPQMTPELAAHFNVIDSFDTHARVPEHFANVDAAAKKEGHLAVISCGWDPGMFSLNRLYASSILPDGKAYTFWGRGVSQGHSQAVRRIPGVTDAIQYTVPDQDAIKAVRSGRQPELTTRQKHTRECFVAAEEGADRAAIENTIRTMPNYFDEYDTTVHFITEEELKRDHAGLPHGGMVIYTGRTGLNKEHNHAIEYDLCLDSNPEFTGAVLVAAARAAVRMHDRGLSGCFTMFDIAPADLSPLTRDELLHTML